jgi:hypothetical protein
MGVGFIVADKLVRPPSISGVTVSNVDNVIEALRGLDVSEVAEKLGDVRVANVYLLGRALLKTRLGAIISFDFDSVARVLRGLANPELNLGSRTRVQGWGFEG